MHAKRIIIMYISKVSGHRSAALAIENAIRAISSQVEVLSIDAFNYTNPSIAKFTNYLYMNVVSKAPKIWGYLYDNPKVVKGLERIKNFVHKFKILFNYKIIIQYSKQQIHYQKFEKLRFVRSFEIIH